MEKEFIPYEQALALKELGFDEKCFNYYGKNNKLPKQLDCMLGLRHHSVNKEFVLAPLYQQAFRWFREKYNINTVVECWNSEWKFTIQLINHCSNGNTEDCFLTYEEAELECLKKLIEIIKNKKKL
jgi:hypothetical protein